MAITLTRNVTKTITELLIKWERDDDGQIQSMDYQMILDNDNRVEVQETFENLIKEAGCTPEQAREQTAEQIARVNAWRNDRWQYVGCAVTAIATETDTETGETLDTDEVEFESVWGIESFAGSDYQKETEDDLASSLRYTIADLGYTLTPEAWDALPRRQADDSYYQPTDTDPGENAKPLPPLPEADSNFTYRYGSESDAKGDYGVDDAEGEVLAVCKHCGVAMLNDDDKDAEGPHYYACERFTQEEYPA